MKFFKTREESHLPSVVMSPEVTLVAEFSYGEFVTEDPAVIELLVGMGYRHEAAEGTEKAPDAPVSEDAEKTNTQAPAGDEAASEAVEALSEAAEEKQPEKMTKGEIAAYALAKYGVAIATNQSKDEMLVLLQAAMENARDK